MTMYQATIPTGLVRLDQDYKNVRDNFTQINSTYNTDHVPLTTAPQNGYHSVIHLAKQASDPVGITATYSMYEKSNSDGFATGQQLYFISGTSTPFPVTRNFVPAVDGSGNGSSFVPGGFVIQWGIILGTHAGFFNSGDTGTVTFSTANLAFPNNLFAVNLQLVGKTPATSSSDNSLFLTDNYTKLLFNWRYNGHSGDFKQFFWWAIGN